MTTFAILNIETDDYYSESLTLKNEFKHAGMLWNNTSIIIPAFARRYTRLKDALRRSQKVSDRTGCVCAVVRLSERIAAEHRDGLSHTRFQPWAADYFARFLLWPCNRSRCRPHRRWTAPKEWQ